MMGRKGCHQFFKGFEVSVTVFSLPTQLCLKLMYLLYLLVPASFALDVVSHGAYIPVPKMQAVTNSERTLNNEKNKDS